MFVRLLIVVCNLPAVATAIFSCVFAVWFSKYQDRNVGPSVTYMAYGLIAMALALLANLVFWAVLRKRASDLRFLRRTTGCVLIFPDHGMDRSSIQLRRRALRVNPFAVDRHSNERPTDVRTRGPGYAYNGSSSIRSH